MEDLTRLGKRIVFLGKGVFLSLLGMAVLFGLINGFFGNPVLMGNDAMSMSVGLITLLLLLLLSIFVLLVFCLVGGICVLVWTFRVTKNLRTKAKTVLSPWVSVIGLIIWYVNIFVQFGIFRNLTHVQEKLLKDAGATVKPVPLKMLTGWFVTSLVSLVVSYNSSSAVCVMAGIILAAASVIFFLKAFEPFVAQHSLLFKLEQEAILRKKVDEVIREREIEKLASEVQQAKFE